MGMALQLFVAKVLCAWRRLRGVKFAAFLGRGTVVDKSYGVHDSL